MADFIADGLGDVAVDGQVNVFLGLPGEKLATPTPYVTAPGPGLVAARDFDGDGKLDLVVASAGTRRVVDCSPPDCDYYCCYEDGPPNGPPGALTLLLGKGDGKFDAALTVLPSSNLTGLAAADVNGDGARALDLVVEPLVFYYSYYIASYELDILLGDGHGAFGAPSVIATPGFTGTFVAADFNGDVNVDLAGGAALVCLGHGDGTFTVVTPPAYEAPFTSTMVAAADLNGDGKTDLLTNQGNVLLGLGDGTFPGLELLVGGSGDTAGIVIDDFNGDGHADVAFANHFGHAVEVFLGAGGGLFGAPTSIDFDSSTAPYSVATGDFNGDGARDLAVGNIDKGSVYVLLGKGDGTFRRAGNYVVASLPVAVAAADFNADGFVDLVSDDLLLAGKGDGTFAAGVSIGSGAGGAAIAVGDLNGDGAPDVVFTSGAVNVFLGKGDGTFLPKVAYTTSTGSPGGLAIGDLNGDGFADIVATSPSVSDVFLGEGDGTFLPRVAYPLAGSSSFATAIADLDSDGKPDILVNGGGDVWLLLGNGAGVFRAAQPYGSSSGSPVSLAVGDLNGDGSMDVVAPAASGGSSAAVVLLNESRCK